MNFVLGGMLFEDVGVTAYAGAATVLKNKDFVAAAAGGRRQAALSLPSYVMQTRLRGGAW
jgi:hypothetical protein